MATFSEMKTALDEIAATISAARMSLDKCGENAAKAQTNLGNLSTEYSGIVAAINQFLSDNASDEAAKTMKAEKDLLVAEFQALQTAAGQMVTAIDGVTY